MTKDINSRKRFQSAHRALWASNRYQHAEGDRGGRTEPGWKGLHFERVQEAFGVRLGCRYG